MKRRLQKGLALMAGSLLAFAVMADELPRAEPEDVGLSAERLARFSAEINKGVAAGHFPGVVAAVARNGKVAFFESYGFRDREAGVEMTDDAIFRIASMTKAVTGVAVMILYEEGHFTLNDPVSKFIPSFKDMRVLANSKSSGKKGDGKKSDNKKDWSQEELDKWLKENWDTLSEEEQAEWVAYYSGKSVGKDTGQGKSGKTDEQPERETVAADRPITIRDLLRHTSGFSYAPGNIWSPGDDLEKLIDNLAAQPLAAQPAAAHQPLT